MVRVAVVGCAHGMLDDIYATVSFINEMDPSRPIELLLCCGDFECMRNSRDLENLACPPKYREMHSFHQFYKGEKVAPVLTIFIGGNHEASNYLSELHYGGWVAPNIFYLGAAGVVNVGGLRIGGLSGIYKQQDYTSGRFEKAPFDNSTMRSIYHVRELEVFQLSHLQMQDPKKVNVFLSHDWPRGIEQYGDVRALIRRKPFFQQEIQSNSLGSPAGEFLLFQLKPQHWFAAHLHVKFAALVRHAAAPAPPPLPPTEITEAATGEHDVNEASEAATPIPPVEEMTKFLALDKCLPRREFLQVLDIGPPTADANQAESSEGADNTDKPTAREPLKIMFDLEWLAVLRATHHLASTSKYAPRVPQEEMRIEDQDIAWVRERLCEVVTEKGLNKVEGEWITDFVKTAPAFGEEEQSWDGKGFNGNPQTDLLLELLKLPHVVTAPYVGGGAGDAVGAVVVDDPNAIDLDDDEDEDEQLEQVEEAEEPTEAANTEVADPNELDIDLSLHLSSRRRRMKSWVRGAAQRARQPSFGLPPLDYGVNVAKLDPALQRAFVQLDCDDETQTFLESCTGGGILESMASSVLGVFYSLTDVNGMLGRGQMFVLSRAQIQRLLHREQRIGGSLLDIGAGDGNVTESIASLVDQVTSTEVSGPMVKSLNSRGFNCVQTADLDHEFVQGRQPYNVISLMNVLDRADKPWTMLKQIRSMLHPENGLFLLAVVLPFSAFVEVGAKRMAPTERLPMRGGRCQEGASFEAAANVLLKNVLQPAGFKLVQFSRVPYLCRGDMRQAYYVLSDAIFVLQVDSEVTPAE